MSANAQPKRSALVPPERSSDLWAKVENAWANARADLIAAPICKRVIEDCFATYAKAYEAQAQAISEFCNEAAPSYSENWQEYLRGAALSLDPLPQTSATFYTSDLDALCSDWITTEADVSKVWKTLELTCKTLEDISDVKFRRWQAADRNADDGERAFIGSAGSADTRNHSSGS